MFAKSKASPPKPPGSGCWHPSDRRFRWAPRATRAKKRAKRDFELCFERKSKASEQRERKSKRSEILSFALEGKVKQAYASSFALEKLVYEVNRE